MTEEELVEKVARAIAVEQLAGETRWHWFVSAARAAIAAMREAGWGPSPPNVVFMTDMTERLLELLDNPPDPNEELKRLMATPRRT